MIIPIKFKPITGRPANWGIRSHSYWLSPRPCIDQAIIDFRTAISIHQSAEVRLPFVKAAMKQARSFVLDANDIGSALRIWQEVRQNAEAPDRFAVVHSIIALAKSLAAPDLPKAEQRTELALAVWRTAYDFEPDPINRHKVINSILGIACDLSSAERPKLQRDIDGAIRLFLAAIEFHFNDKLVFKNMARQANQLVKARENDAASAVRLYNTLYSISRNTPTHQLVVQFMMRIAHELSDCDGPIEKMDIAAAIMFWEALYKLDRSQDKIDRSEDEHDRILRNMLVVADYLEKRGAIENAKNIWLSACALTTDPTFHRAVARIMWLADSSKHD